MFSKVILEDIDDVCQIIKDAQERMKEDNLIQWQDGYPNREIILNDIELSQIYKYEIDNVIVGICVINSDFYDSYPKHPSKEKSQVIHRLAVKDDVLSQGIGSKILTEAMKYIKSKGYKYLLIDTFTLNLKMVNLIEKNEFIKIDEFKLVDGAANWVLYSKEV